MGEEEHREKNQTEELYSTIGRFVVKFEHVCLAMSGTVIWALQFDGLRTQRLGDAVLAGLTPDPLRKVFGAVLAEVRDDDELDKRLVGNVLKRVQKLTERRNDVIHRAWFIGWGSSKDDDFSKASGWRFENTKKGAEFRPLSYTVAEFDGLSAEADELTNIITRMTGCLMLGQRYTDNFNVDPDGTVRRGPKS